jgi:hypothetical protein
MHPHRLLALALVAACDYLDPQRRNEALLGELRELRTMLRTGRTQLGLALGVDDIAMVRDTIPLIEGAQSGHSLPATACRRRW